jgi:hypothetical protein
MVKITVQEFQLPHRFFINDFFEQFRNSFLGLEILIDQLTIE